MTAISLPAKNPMVPTLMAVLLFEVVTFGLAIPGIVLVEGTPAAKASLWCGIAMALAALGAFTLRRGWGWLPAWTAQVAGALLGLLTSMMWFVGGLFALLFCACFVMGRRIEATRAGSRPTA